MAREKYFHLLYFIRTPKENVLKSTWRTTKISRSIQKGVLSQTTAKCLRGMRAHACMHLFPCCWPWHGHMGIRSAGIVFEFSNKINIDIVGHLRGGNSS